MTTRGTSYREATDWRTRAACAGNPEMFDLDHIYDSPNAIKNALHTCSTCPVLQHCIEWTKSLPLKHQPQELIQAGRVWTQTTRKARSSVRLDQVDQLRRRHSEYTRRRQNGEPVDDTLLADERAYQRSRKRTQRKSQEVAS